MLDTPTDLSALTPGFADPVRDAQAVFRRVLDALAGPGSVHALPALPPAPPPLSGAAAAVLLALADLDTPVWLAPELATPAVAGWLRFHAGCPLTETPGEAAFAVGGPQALEALGTFATGTPEYPERSATLIIQVAALHPDRGAVLRGPGIRDSARLDLAALPPGFIDAWTANHAAFPQGVDLLLVSPTQVCGLPRTTRITA